ncbi:putative phosphoglycerate mutase family protein [Xylaria bambusicola]|uniref:putative phosphoglycerate mutase family protein n=1 Tax=Xylaria bambusicola TaxID=326684 RepID=UPI002007F511|nr:putative phosphoglycerate mutase family protein [Xylaria bambusicola]KAI0517336.1 putative phosphoglycerate mutase family protein [Xylaria bambusicola]
MQLSSALFFASLAATLVAAAEKPTVYLIRHGEKPEDDDVTGLSMEGEQRAQCLRDVFGASSQYNIGYILAQTPKDNGKRSRPYLTVKPLADDLGLTVDTSCDRDDAKCVKDAVKDYDGEGNILICWQHGELSSLAEKLGADDVDDYPSDSYDLIWTQPYPYKEITSVTSENCPGLDN